MSKAKFVASSGTRSSTFAIRKKTTLKPKIAKELALPQPHIASLLHLESVKKKQLKNKNQLLTNVVHRLSFVIKSALYF
jgi:hypothetical protein